MPRLTKSIQFAVHFANFSNNTGISPPDLGLIISYAKAASSAYVRDNNRRESSAATKLEEIAQKYGYSVQWGGLWPTLIKDNYSHFLPSE